MTKLYFGSKGGIFYNKNGRKIYLKKNNFGIALNNTTSYTIDREKVIEDAVDIFKSMTEATNDVEKKRLYDILLTYTNLLFRDRTTESYYNLIDLVMSKLMIESKDYYIIMKNTENENEKTKMKKYLKSNAKVIFYEYKDYGDLYNDLYDELIFYIERLILYDNKYLYDKIKELKKELRIELSLDDLQDIDKINRLKSKIEKYNNRIIKCIKYI